MLHERYIAHTVALSVFFFFLCKYILAMTRRQQEYLTTATDWDTAHSGKHNHSFLAPLSEKLFGKRGHRFIRAGGLPMHILREAILARHIPVRSDWNMLEIGCAPGQILAGLHRRFGYAPFGIDYSPEGIAQTLPVLAELGFDASHVVQADLFDDGYVATHRASFDVVCSFGVIEHFEQPALVVARHTALVRPGGFVVITIPNLTGLYLAACRVFNSAVIPKHNTAIMSLAAFKNCFKDARLEECFCGYVGPTTSSLLNSPPRTLRKSILTAIQMAERPWQFLRLGLFGTRFVSSRWFSPYLVFVGQVRDK